jgi:hypothetical protein
LRLRPAVIMNDLGRGQAGRRRGDQQACPPGRRRLGLAIIDTVFAAVYTDQIDAKLARLTAARRERATESI